MTNQELISLFEHIRYQIVVFPKERTSPQPQSVGSGFMLDYKGMTFFVTADHVVNTHNKDVRKIEDNIITVSTNESIKKDGICQTKMIPIGGFYFFDQFKVDIDKSTINNMPLFDAAFSILQEWQINTKCITCEVKIEGANVPYGENKIHIKDTDIVNANIEDTYCVFGRVKFSLVEKNGTTFLTSQQTFKSGLKLVTEDNTQNYFILRYPKELIYEDWAGLSGSAVLNQDGKLIGILCAVNTSGNRLIWVKKIKRVLPLMDAAILENNL